jgi:hypothetical protein
LSLPAFTAEGLLPPGVHRLHLSALPESLLVRKPAQVSARWDEDRRRAIADALCRYVPHLWHVGVPDVFLDGSYVTDKAQPQDADCYFDCVASDWPMIQTRLRIMDPLWTWDLRQAAPKPGSRVLHLSMWHLHRLEFFPNFPGLVAGMDSSGMPRGFPEFFRQTRDGQQKGIVQLVP